MMNFQLSEEHEQLREMIRDFAVNEVAPTAAERDENETLIALYGIKWRNLV